METYQDCTGDNIDLSKSGGSLSFGPRSAKFTVGSRGKRATVGNGSPKGAFLYGLYKKTKSELADIYEVMAEFLRSFIPIKESQLKFDLGNSP